MNINLMELEPRHAHDLLTSAIIPRSIAWVSTIDKDGQANPAPFSFFTGVSWSPPIPCIFSGQSIRRNYEGHSDKHSIKGIHWIPSKKIKPYRVKEAKISFECTLERIVTVSEGPDAGNLILGRIQLVHIRDRLLRVKQIRGEITTALKGTRITLPLHPRPSR